MTTKSREMNVCSIARVAVFMILLGGCAESRQPDVSDVEQGLNSCALLTNQMAFCSFPIGSHLGCFCDRDQCIDILQQCGVTDPSEWAHCFQTCPIVQVEPQPPFVPSEQSCEALKNQHSLPPWHICNYPRCWNLPPGESCIVPLGGGGGSGDGEYGSPES